MTYRSLLAATCAATVLAAPAAAQERTITAVGTASMRPVPENARSSDSIRDAVRTARAEVLTEAFSRGRLRAAELSRQSGLPLGSLLSVAEGGGAPAFYYGSPFGEEGTFGPGRFCGTVRRPVVRTDARGRRRVVGRRTTRQCRIPTVSASVTLTFAVATPPPAG